LKKSLNNTNQKRLTVEGSLDLWLFKKNQVLVKVTATGQKRLLNLDQNYIP